MAKGKPHRIEIEAADNGGYTMRKHYKSTSSSEPKYIEPEHTVYENGNHMMKDLKSCLQDDGGPKNSPASSSTAVKKAIIEQAVSSKTDRRK